MRKITISGFFCKSEFLLNFKNDVCPLIIKNDDVDTQLSTHVSINCTYGLSRNDVTPEGARGAKNGDFG